MKTGRDRLIARPGLQTSQVTRADIEALRASDRLQRIFDSGLRPEGGAPRAVAAKDISASAEGTRAEYISAGRAEGAARSRRGLLGSGRARLVVGLAAACLGLVVLADDLPWLPEGTEPDAAVAGAEIAAGTASPVPPVPVPKPREPTGAVALDGAGQASAAPEFQAKVSGELGKPMNSAAVIRRAIARNTSLAIPQNGAATPAEPDTLPQAIWPAQNDRPARPRPSALAIPLPVPADPARPVGEQPLATAGTVAQPEAPAHAEPAAAAASTSPLVAPEPPQTTSGPMRVVLHYRGADGEETARRLASALQSRGVADAALRRVPMDVAQANVRFFHDENRSAATEIGELMHSLGYGSEVMDFTHYSPPPTVGTIEVWLPG